MLLAGPLSEEMPSKATEERSLETRSVCLMTIDDEHLFAAEQHPALSRRRFLKGSVRTVGAALASAGIYELIDTIAQPPERPAFAATEPLQEQYIVQNVRIIM